MRSLLRRLARHPGPLAVGIVLLGLQALAPAATALGVASSVRDLTTGLDGSPLSLGVLAALVLGDTAVGWLRTRVSRGLALRTASDLRCALLERDLAAGGGPEALGDRLNRLLAEVDEVVLAVSGLVTALRNPLALVLLLGSVAALAEGWTALGLLVAPMVAGAVAWAGRSVRVAAEASAAARAALSSELADTLHAASAIASVGVVDEEVARARGFVDADAAARLRLDLARQAPAAAMRLVAVVCVLGAGLWGAHRGQFLDAGALAGVVTAGALALRPLNALGEGVGLVRRGLAALDRVESALRRLPVRASGGVRIGEGALSLSVAALGVTVGGRRILSGVDLELQAGQVGLLLGPVGAGKSTLLRVVAGRIAVWDGTVRIAGQSLRDADPRSLSERMAWVPQEPTFLRRTVAENVRMGRRVDLPGGLASPDRPMGEGGGQLSGGERQGVALARALAGRPGLLLLDEPGRSMDAASRATLWTAVRASGATVLVAAHEAEIPADVVYEIDGGRVRRRP